MATKAGSKKDSGRYVLDNGVGVDWATNEHGWGLNRMPYLAVMVHPLHGIQAHGPFIDEDAASKWIRDEGPSEILHFYDGIAVQDTKWHTLCIHVPTHEVRR
jgi:hypothetical protein